MNVPKLRFKEFTDEWKQTPLKNIIYSNIIEAPKPTTDYIRLGIRSHCKGTFHELVKIENILSADKMYIVPKNNLILNITFAWEQAIAITDDNDEGKYISNRFPTFAFKDNQLPTFYKYIIPQKRLKYDLNVASPGGAGRNRVLNKKLFLSIPVNIPLLKEQEKIAKFLTTVDKKITNLENIITSLENQKKGLLQQIFSQKLRFKDKNGNNYPNWEKKKLEDISNITMGQSPDSDFVNTEKIGTPFLQGNAEFTNKYPIEKYWCTKPQKIANPTDILLSVRAPVGAINIANKKFCIGRGLSAISFNCNKLFGKYNLKFNLFQLIKKSQGSTFSSINKKDISEVILFIPCLEEQTKIADFLSAFDRKLENQKAQLEHWKQIKKGLLQQMFV
ncbi:restriction endonuclease subunit S [uncultured Megamonas sp.]|jgi:type I restriction enzyme S subunit|uniref:restriction endonuclease subunit S n=1 Tax=uncultured Megamonas sp. TaxID=286140 RepID=UPI002592E1E4|nr:restriction endonuclease subunit S [uncultured Megamonas sp.]